MKLLLLAASFLLAASEARNFGPPSQSARNLSFKAPAVSMSGHLGKRVQEGGDVRTDVLTDPDLVGEDFSWLDPMVQSQLWGAAKGGEKATLQQLAKRKPARIGSALFQPDCLGCIKSGVGLDLDINQLTWQDMQSRMKSGVRTQMRDSCIFYTGLPDADKKSLSVSTASIYFGTLWTDIKDQSRAATEFACKHNIVSIWMLWPGKNENDDGSSTSKLKRNYYELRAGSWLDEIDFSHDADASSKSVALRAKYFRAMSQAVAESCSGKVYVMAVQLKTMGVYKGIWPDVEYPALLRLQMMGTVTDLIGIDSQDPSKQYLMNFAAGAPTVNKQITASDSGFLSRRDLMDHGWLEDDNDDSFNATIKLAKRDTCTANLGYSDASPEDWFG